jgi:pimeloyl-ACP methyl ester carboxylesterase
MKKKILKGLLYLVGGTLLLMLALIIILAFNSTGRPDPIVDHNGNQIPGSISTIEQITLAGQRQHLFIRGADSTKPVMLFIHGGPGSPEMPIIKAFNRDIENHFVMVYWEQLGAGKSFRKDIPLESMNLARFIEDACELSQYLGSRFGTNKIFVMGHSWGSLLGIKTVHLHPELFHAYFGIGQVADQLRGELISFEWVKQESVLRNDKKAMKKLSAMSFPDSLSTSGDWVRFLTSERAYVTKYGGAMYNESKSLPMVLPLLLAREYTLSDKVRYIRGMLFSLHNMWDDVIGINLLNDIDSLQVPAYFFHGAGDYQTPYIVAREFYEQLKAPRKEFFTFENSAHSPIWEEPERFNQLVKTLAYSKLAD